MSRAHGHGLLTRLRPHSHSRSHSHSHSHDSADRVDDALEASAEGIRTVKISLVVLLATAVLQAALVVVTGSVALLADTVHNLSDALTALPLWLAFALGRRASTRRFTYGFGRAEDLAGVFVVLMIALSALVTGWQSVQRLLDPRPPEHLGVLVAAGLVGFVGNELVAGYRMRSGRRIGSAALVADGLHARADGFTSLAVVAGALGVWAGFPLADPLVGLAITVAILVLLRTAARDVLARLMDAVDPALVDLAEQSLRETPGVLDARDVRLRWTGHRLLAEATVVVDAGASLLQAHAIAVDAQHRGLHAVPRLAAVTVHVDPGPRPGNDPHAVLAGHPRP